VAKFEIKISGEKSAVLASSKVRSNERNLSEQNLVKDTPKVIRIFKN